MPAPDGFLDGAPRGTWDEVQRRESGCQTRQSLSFGELRRSMHDQRVGTHFPKRRWDSRCFNFLPLLVLGLFQAFPGPWYSPASVTWG